MVVLLSPASRSNPGGKHGGSRETTAYGGDSTPFDRRRYRETDYFRVDGGTLSNLTNSGTVQRRVSPSKAAGGTAPFSMQPYATTQQTTNYTVFGPRGCWGVQREECKIMARNESSRFATREHWLKSYSTRIYHFYPTISK